MAVIGFGFMGVTHAKNIIESGRLELCGIVDKREGDIFAGIANTGNHGALDLPLERLKKTPVYKTLEECVEKEKPDAVSVCVPLFLHYNLTEKALNLGLDVLLEKPFCREIEQCRKLIDLAQHKKRILMVAHCIRFSQHWEFLSQCIRDGRYGKLHLLSTSRTAGEPTWGVWRDPEIRKTCGGALFDLLIHDIDFVNYSLAKPSAMKISLKRDEYWELSFTCGKDNADVSIKGGFLYRYSPFTEEYAATFDCGSIRFCSLQPDTIHIGTDKGAQTVSVKSNPYMEELNYFTGCMETRGKPFRCLPEDSLYAIEVCRKLQSESSGNRAG